VTRRALVAAVAACAAWGQTPVPQPAPRAPTFRTEANYVRVDAYPTRNGAPIEDLTRDDFEILEGGQPQKIEQFERVSIRGNTPQELRREPNTVRESLEMASNPRARVMVVFLDTGHVGVDGSHRIRQPLIDMLNRFVSEDDVVAVMTPQMSARDITFARRTTAIETFLTKNWPWGERDTLVMRDPIEQMFEGCYGPSDKSALTRALIARYRERKTLEALIGLTDWLHDVREERKAILAVTDGWQLYRSDGALLNRDGAAPPAIGTVPGTGRLAIAPDPPTGPVDSTACERYRAELAYFDGEQQYRLLLDRANRANASFYPVTPAGLVVFASPLGPSSPLPLVMDGAVVRQRADSMRTLADATDGLAIISNDLDRVLRRVVSDLSSYYLLGYYSSGKLDGRFHPISVRVKRPGVQVRARRGYLAASTGAIGTETTPPTVDAEAAARSAAILPLENYMRDVPLRLQAAAGWKPGADPLAAVWVSGELGGVAQVGDAWKGGAVVDAQLLTPAGKSIVTATATIAAGARSFRVGLTPVDPIAAGEYVIRVSARAGSAVIPSRDSLHLQLPAAPGAAGALWIRRGPATANREVPTADLRFRRAEQVRVEIPTLTSTPGQARLLDRAGRTLAIPVTAATRDDSDGSRWMTAQLALAALAPGDYIIELSEGEQRMLTAFRVIP
jgi:VWFA-related protein